MGWSYEIDNRLDDLDLVRLLELRGYTLKRLGSHSYGLVLGGEVSSLHIFWSCRHQAWRWKRFSQTGANTFGGTVTLLCHLEGMSWKEAMQELGGKQDTQYDAPKKQVKAIPEPRSNTFVLPPKNDRWENGKPPYARLFGYLCDHRHIDREIVLEMIRLKLLYLSREQKEGFAKPVYNCIFVGYDSAGVPRWAAVKGTNSRHPFTGTVSNSDPRCCFFVSRPSDTVCVFEAPIDALSFLTVYRDCNDSILALGGLDDRGLEQRLADNPHIRKLVFCLDNDLKGTQTQNGKCSPHNHGQRRTDELIEKYEALGYECFRRKPPRGKDWNEYLCSLPLEVQE